MAEWFHDVARAVHKLIRHHGARPRFLQMIRHWAARRKARWQEHANWIECRNKHFRDLAELPCDDPLRVESETPPRPDWKYDSHWITNGGPDSVVSGWTSPDIHTDAEPDTSHFLTLPSGREVTIDEAYTVLAAIYNKTRGVKQLNPWDGTEGSNESLLYTGVQMYVTEHMDKWEGTVGILLDTVRDDLDLKQANRG